LVEFGLGQALVIFPTLISNFEIDGVSSLGFAAGLAPFCYFCFFSAGAPPSYFLFSSFGFYSYFPCLSPPASGFLPPASGFLPASLAAFCSFYQAALAIAFNYDLVSSGAFSFGNLTKSPRDNTISL